MSQTLRWRLAIPYVVLVILTVIGLSLYLISFIRNTYLDNLKTSLTAEARIIADATGSYLVGYTDQPTVYDTIERFSSRLDARVTIIYPDGTVLADSEANPSEMDNHLNRPEVKAAAGGQEASEIRYSSTLGENLLYVAVPVRSGNQLTGIARVAKPLEQIDAYLSQLRQTITAITLAAIFIAVLISLLMTGYTIRPLQDLTEATRQITSGDLNAKSLPVTHDEIGQLNQAFNLMAVQLRSQIEALQAERGKLGAVLAHMTDGVIIADGDSRVQLINPAAARMFDISEENATGHTLAEVIRHHQLVELWRSCHDTGKQRMTTLELPADKLFLQSIATSLSPALPGSTLLLFQDLTRLHRLETVRQDFVSNVSHELRTPLASLKALTETLHEGALEDPPAARRFLSRMDAEIDTITQMVRELLELAKIESGKVPLQRKSLTPNTLIEPAVERMHLQAERAGLRLRMEYPPDLPMVHADPDRLEQVLVNLLHNAIKFTPPGGEILVSALASDGQVVFLVRDTGVGIAGKDLSRIFERFYKADRARSGGGTGLGLSIARHLIEAHGGKIWAESIQGQGSSFYFSLPTASKG